MDQRYLNKSVDKITIKMYITIAPVTEDRKTGKQNDKESKMTKATETKATETKAPAKKRPAVKTYANLSTGKTYLANRKSDSKIVKILINSIEGPCYDAVIDGEDTVVLKTDLRSAYKVIHQVSEAKK